MKELLLILKHDLHKLKIRGSLPHSRALVDKDMKKADGIASWFSRNGISQKFNKNDRLYVRKSYVNISKEKKDAREIAKIFKETNPSKLHTLITGSKVLNHYSEALVYPYTSFKYHILLATALYYNISNNYRWQQLYLSENNEIESQFQVIYSDPDREWALLPNGGMSRVSPRFNITWVRRTQPSIGGESQVLDMLISQTGSWSTALATIEDWRELKK